MNPHDTKTSSLADIAMKIDFMALDSHMRENSAGLLQKYAGWLRDYHAQLTAATQRIAELEAHAERLAALWHARLHADDSNAIFVTTPELRDALTRLSADYRAAKETGNSPGLQKPAQG